MSEIKIGDLVSVKDDNAKRIGQVINMLDAEDAHYSIALVSFTWNALAVADRNHLEMVYLRHLRLEGDRRTHRALVGKVSE